MEHPILSLGSGFLRMPGAWIGQLRALRDRACTGGTRCPRVPCHMHKPNVACVKAPGSQSAGGPSNPQKQWPSKTTHIHNNNKKDEATEPSGIQVLQSSFSFARHLVASPDLQLSEGVGLARSGVCRGGGGGGWGGVGGGGGGGGPHAA